MIGPRDPYVKNTPGYPLCRRPTTKLLINHFETLSHPAVVAQISDDVQRTQSNDGKTGRRKEGNPVRQSLKNLMSVFVKRNGFLGLSRARLVGRRSVVGHTTLVPHELNHPPSTTLILPPVDLSDASSKWPQTSPSLYHRRNAYEADTLTVSWAPCAVTVEHDCQLVISYQDTWVATRPPQETISLSCFTDVRSVSPKNISLEEYDALPSGGPEEMKVFEILFEGRPRERFATPSSIERAEWLSKIWFVCPLIVLVAFVDSPLQGCRSCP